MMNSKQRAMLRSMANTLETILYIGKDGVTDATVKEAYDALEARELIKCAVQNNSELTAKEASAILSERTHAETVQCIGRRFVLYRESREKKIQLD
ncbi:MAG TPA: YhbY family RNA-binding protein [Candidatus Limiplasma sp.]|nr:YhbY family RNA-binding protein [Candidatus Limiplasma sp.]HPR77258.1 YhbY family RNA-binding protein [Candidatus Limiplasma sp.]